MSSPVTDVQTRRARLLIAGRWVEGRETFPVHDKFTGEVIGVADRASREQVDEAVAAALASFHSMALEPYRRFELLRGVSELVEQRGRELASLIVAEAGFPVTDAMREVHRTVQTFLVSAEEAKRLAGEMVPIEGAPGQAHRMAFTIRVPRGVVCGITSFNSPLNMVAHKVAPALASGNTVVVKPPQVTPLTAALLFDILLEAGIPPGHVSLIQGPGAEVGEWLATNPSVAFYTFTGSTSVGKQLRKNVGLRPLALELGSIAATIVCDDADLDRAAQRCASSAFRRAGQACTSVQRLFVHEDVLGDFVDRLVAATQQLPVGDPHNPATEIGPMISESDAIRAERWVREAIDAGARLLYGGQRRGALLYPTILTDVRDDMRVVCEEIFGPVVSVISFRSLDEAVNKVNATPYGIATGIFASDVTKALHAAKRLRVGVVHVNDASSSRVDMMPFGGVKDSGLGREGPKYAMQEMTEERLITISLA